MENGFPFDFSETTKAAYCTYYNRTKSRLIFNTYKGIPENLMLNILGCVLLVLFFSFMRRKAWNCSQLEQANNDHEKWARVFYGSSVESSGYLEDGTSTTPVTNRAPVDSGFFAWFLAVIYLKDEKILQKCGYDAVQYLSFQSYITVLVGVITVVSLAIVLPINICGDLEGDGSTFGHTTVSNLHPNSPWLWVHVSIAMLYFPLTIFVMRRFSAKLKMENNGNNWSRTLMITNIPRNDLNTYDLAQHLKEAYPEFEVENIKLAYDINKANHLQKHRDAASKAIQYCNNHLKTVGKRLMVQPHMCGYILICCGLRTSRNLDAIDFYIQEESHLTAELEKEKQTALKRPLGIAFVTMTTIRAAQKIYQDHVNEITILRCPKPPTSSVSDLLQPHKWVVKFAPSPDDIIWENLNETYHSRYCKGILTNTSLLVSLFFLTTPVIVLNVLDTLILKEFEKFTPVVAEFMPTLLLLGITAFLPVMVIKSDHWLRHWSRSKQNHSIMRKTFVLLLFMGLILPSLGLTSAQALLDLAFKTGIETYRWHCVFLPDKGAFFVNYVITSALIGTSMELVRFPELFIYSIRLTTARSKAESDSARRLVVTEFSFGVQYAWMLLIFAIVTVYSVSCPLITPFGLLYMATKNFVDRYNIYYAFEKSKISKNVHRTAISFVMATIVLLQFSFTTLSLLRYGLHLITWFSLISLFITLVFTLSQCFFDQCSVWSTVFYQVRIPHTDQANPATLGHNTSAVEYYPEVLRQTLLATAANLNTLPLTPNDSSSTLEDLEIEIKNTVHHQQCFSNNQSHTHMLV